MQKKHLIYYLFFLTNVLLAQETSVQHSIDTTQIRIGEQIEYKIAVTNSTDVVFPDKLENLERIEQLESKKIDTLKEKLIKRYILTSFDSGTVTIPKQEIYVNKARHVLDSLQVEVALVKVDTLEQNLFPIKPVKGEPITWRDYLTQIWIALGILFVLLVILILYVFRNKYKVEKTKPKLKPIEAAYLALQELDQKNLLEKQKIKAYYVELTDIIRHYFENELQMPALESTSDELLHDLKKLYKQKKVSTNNKTIQTLKKLLKTSDLVKFAKLKPSEEIIQKHREETQEIIDTIQHKKIEQKNDA